jgi:DNA polymerase III subunit delta
MKKDNIFFWTGEEDFSIREKKKYWKDNFALKHGGDLNISSVDAKEVEIKDLISQLETFPFLAEKRLIFIENLPPKAVEKFDAKKIKILIEALKDIPETSIVVFIQSTPDKRNALYKALIKTAQVEEYKKLNPLEREHWLQSYLKKRNVEILPTAVSFFIQQAGDNLWRLSNEADKLISYTNKEKRISENDIQKLVMAEVSSNVFSFLDAFSEKNSAKAIKELHNIIDEGESLMQVFALLTKHIRTLLLASSVKNISKDILVRELKIHPFVAQKTVSSVRNFDFHQLKVLYKVCLDIDRALKTGEISLSVYNEKALALRLETMILSLSIKT